MLDVLLYTGRRKRLFSFYKSKDVRIKAQEQDVVQAGSDDGIRNKEQHEGKGRRWATIKYSSEGLRIFCCIPIISLVPRLLFGGGERAWYTLFAHAPNRRGISRRLDSIVNFRSKNISIKMLKDVGMTVRKIRET